jgi:hypothetical protein
MGIFSKKITDISSSEKSLQEEPNAINERPRICCIDIDDSSINILGKNGFNIYAGTLGKKINVPNTTRKENHQLLLNFDFPSNLHEFDIIIMDLESDAKIPYNPEEHIRKTHTGKSAVALLSSYPETVFDPRPLGSLILNDRLNQIGKRPHIIIAFTVDSYDIEYETIRISEGYPERQGVEKYSIYSFAGHAPLSNPKEGKEMTVTVDREDLKKLLESHLSKTIYNQTFYHPTIWDSNKQIPNPDVVPLIKNSSGDIVSLCEFRDNSIIFYFPQIEDKGDFLNSFLTRIAPDLMPDLFPFATTFSWTEAQDYWLPNHKELLDQQNKIQIEYDEKLKSKELEIINNKEQYSFLHEILTESGDKLVEALIKYFKWLGYSKINKIDEEKSESKILEEDIQVELPNGILIIECKGIGGTSTDSDCSQISKIKHRRCKERGKFDVFALYIVNHQRYLPPLNRQNPPFTNNQKQDAVNDERGLLSTWQLFKAYNEIENGILVKDDVKKDLLTFGYIKLLPKNLLLIDEPQEIFKDGEVCIVNVSNIELKISEEILVEKNGIFEKNIIEGIQLNEKPVSSANNGELGLKLKYKIKKKSRLWKKASS